MFTFQRLALLQKWGKVARRRLGRAGQRTAGQAKIQELLCQGQLIYLYIVKSKPWYIYLF